MTNKQFLHNKKVILEALNVLPADDAAAILSTCLISHLKVICVSVVSETAYNYLQQGFIEVGQMLDQQEHVGTLH
jgi:predicted Fe-Mo cluster-binding NifX family protein